MGGDRCSGVGAGSKAEERARPGAQVLGCHLAARRSPGDGLHRRLAAVQVLGVRKITPVAVWTLSGPGGREASEGESE